MIRHFLLLLPIFFSTLLCAQTQDDWTKLGDEAIADGDPYGALLYYQKAMYIDSARGELVYKYANALRENHQYRNAAYYYYKTYRREQGKVYPLSGFYLAQMQKQSGDYKASKATWRRVRDQFENEPESFEYKKAIQEMRACDFSILWMKEDTLSLELQKIEMADGELESQFDGQFYQDSLLQFSRLSGNYNDKNEVVSAEGSYRAKAYQSQPPYSESVLISEGDEELAGISFSIDSTYKAILRSDSDFKNSIELWQGDKKLQELPAEGEEAWYSHPQFGMIGESEVLLFSSDRKGTLGGSDIWYLELDSKRIKNLGVRVNSIGNEITPFYKTSEDAIYFASDWHYGLGGFDIFKADVNGGDVDFPQNLKPPYNSPANDLYYTYEPEQNLGCITSNRSETQSGTCCNDLWMFSEPSQEELLPEIQDLESLNAYLPVVLYFHNDEPDPRTRKSTTSMTYVETYRDYTAMLPSYREQYRQGLSADEKDKAEEEMESFFLDEIDGGIWDLELFMQLLESELAKGSRVEITIKGFASPLAETDYNVKLTSRRISSLINYIRDYNRGSLIPFIRGTAPNGGKIVFNEIPFGEYVASNYISDNPNESDAVYSIHAARERKIEISSVQQAKSEQAFQIQFDKEIIDLGQINLESKPEFTFNYVAEGSVKVGSVNSPSGVVDVEVSGETIKGYIMAGVFEGKQVLQLDVVDSSGDLLKQLHLTFEVVE